MSDQEREDLARLARATLVQSLVSELVPLAVMTGLIVWMARKEWLIQQGRRARQLLGQQWRATQRQAAADRAVEDLRRDISAYEHERRADS